MDIIRTNIKVLEVEQISFSHFDGSGIAKGHVLVKNVTFIGKLGGGVYYYSDSGRASTPTYTLAGLYRSGNG